MPFSPTNFSNNQPPPLSATQMNKLGTQYAEMVNDLATPGSAPLNSLTGENTPLRVRREDYVTFQDFGAKCNYFDVENPVDESVQMQQAVQYALDNNKSIYVYGNPFGSISTKNGNLRFLVASGSRWVQPKGRTAILHEQEMLGGDAGWAITSISNVEPSGAGDAAFGEPSEFQYYSYIQTSNANLTASNPQQGDVIKVSSKDVYAGNYLGSSDAPHTYKSEWVKVVGLGVIYTEAADINVRFETPITGLTSGATGFVAGVGDLYGSTNKMLFLNVVSGVFLDGETLIGSTTPEGSSSPITPGQNVGVVVSKGIVTPPLVNTFTTAPIFHKGRNDLEVDLGTIKFVAEGDPDIITNNGSDRAPAVELRSCIDSKGTIDVTDSWRQGIRASGCYGGEMTVRIKKLPGYATDTQSAWGYGFEAFGATDSMTVNLDVENVRHGFSTNVRPRAAGNPPVGLYGWATAGVAKDITVRGSARNCTDAGGDTHGGSMFIRFSGLTVSHSMSGSRDQARPTGIQNRSFGTIIDNCVIDGFTDGIRDISTFFPAPFNVTTHYSNIKMRNIMRWGIAMTQTGTTDESLGYAELDIDNVKVEHRNMPAPTAMLQAGIRARSGRIRVKDLTVKSYNDAYISVDGGAGGVQELTVKGGLADISTSPGQPYLIRINTGAIGNLTVTDLDIRTGGKSIPSIIRAGASSVLDNGIRTSGCGVVDANGTPQIVSGSITTATVFGRRSAGNELRGSATWSPSAGAGATVTTTQTINNAAPGDFVMVSPQMVGGLIITGSVTSGNTVTLSASNPTGGTLSPGSTSFSILVKK